MSYYTKIELTHSGYNTEDIDKAEVLFYKENTQVETTDKLVSLEIERDKLYENKAHPSDISKIDKEIKKEKFNIKIHNKTFPRYTLEYFKDREYDENGGYFNIIAFKYLLKVKPEFTMTVSGDGEDTEDIWKIDIQDGVVKKYKAVIKFEEESIL